jgi:D-alanyl-D-alanine carboxypeptidase (penicillin-binding protein 5/6)
MPKGESERVVARIIYEGPLQAPVVKGAPVGRLQIMRGDVTALETPLYAGDDVGVGSLRQRALDGLFEVSTGWMRRAFTSVADRI